MVKHSQAVLLGGLVTQRKSSTGQDDTSSAATLFLALEEGHLCG